jgi:5-(carboxyamino)imidazole ribonucleotide synthase
MVVIFIAKIFYFNQEDYRCATLWNILTFVRIMQQYISSNLSIGILGGGQLGKMLTDITRKWDIRTHILDSNAGAPAKNSCYRFVQGDLMDYETVLNFGKEVEVLTIEIEHVNIDALYELEKAGVLVYPKPATLDIIQNKQTQKAFFEQQKLPTAPFISCENKKELLAHISNGSVDFPFIWKAARFGYDGFGVKKIDNKAAIDALPDNPCIIEALVPIKQEIAIIAARNPDGEIVLYPPVGMAFHPEANQVEYVYFPAEISKEIAKKAHYITHKLVSAWAHVGLLAVEFFVDQENNLLINEVAPRPHNSGHLTIEGANTSQFEQHIRAILNAPLGKTSFQEPTIMANVVGPQELIGTFVYDGIDHVLNTPQAALHIYGKKTTKPQRKMGHITLTGADLNVIFKKIKDLKAKLKLKAN